MTEGGPEVQVTPREAFHSPESSPRIPLPERVVRLGEKKIKVLIGPEKARAGLGVSAGEEEKNRFAIYFQDEQGKTVKYRDAEGPVEHLHKTSEGEYNNAVNEAKVVTGISAKPVDMRAGSIREKSTVNETDGTVHTEPYIAVPTGFINKLPGSLEGQSTNQGFRAIESGAAGFNLLDTLTALEENAGESISPAQRDALELSLVSQALSVLQGFSEMGYRKRHPYLNNFQVGEDGHVTLTDYSEAHKLSEAPPAADELGGAATDAFLFLAYLDSNFPAVMQKAGFPREFIDVGSANDKRMNSANLRFLQQRVTEQMATYSEQDMQQIGSKVETVMVTSALAHIGVTTVTDEDRRAVSEAVLDVVIDAPTIVYPKKLTYVPVDPQPLAGK